MVPTAYKFGMFLLHVVFSTKERDTRNGTSSSRCRPDSHLKHPSGTDVPGFRLRHTVPAGLV